MNSFDTAKRSSETTRGQQPHLEILESATETQAIISWGEEVLDRVHRVADGIEEHVRRLLDAPPLTSGTEPRP